MCFIMLNLDQHTFLDSFWYRPTFLKQFFWPPNRKCGQPGLRKNIDSKFIVNLHSLVFCKLAILQKFCKSSKKGILGLQILVCNEIVRSIMAILVLDIRALLFGGVKCEICQFNDLFSKSGQVKKQWKFA